MMLEQIPINDIHHSYFSRFGDTYTIMLHVCGPLARTGKIYELVQAYFPGASIRVRF